MGTTFVMLVTAIFSLFHQGHGTINTQATTQIQADVTVEPSVTPSESPTPTEEPTVTPTETPTPTDMPVLTPTETPTATPTVMVTPTVTPVPSVTPTPTGDDDHDKDDHKWKNFTVPFGWIVSHFAHLRNDERKANHILHKEDKHKGGAEGGE